MRVGRASYLRYGILATAAAVLLLVLLACGAQETPTPAPAAPTATVVPARPTPAPVQATPTSALPTPTPVAAAKPVYGGTLRWATSWAIDAPDPAYSTQAATRRLFYLMYNGLVELMPDGSVGPDLARSWDFSSDGKTVTFQLQKDVKFHDGTNLDAQAVKWNFDRYLDPKVASLRRLELSPPMQRVEAVGDQTVIFYLSAPFRPLLAILTQQAGLIASPTAIQKYNSYADRNGEFGRHPVGSGPFKFQVWVPGSHFGVVRSNDYWEKGLPYLDAVWKQNIGDKAIQLAMVRTGEVDIIEDIRAEDAAIVERNPNLQLVETVGSYNRFVFFRTSAKPWDSKPLRQAFGYAVDRKTIVQAVFAGKAFPAQSVVGPATGAWYDPTVQVYDYSPQKARQKLAEAGYTKGFSFTMPCRADGESPVMCEALQAMLAESGITMEIQPWAAVTFFSDWMVARKHNNPIYTGFAPRPDPSMLIRLLYHSKGSQNALDYNNPQVDELLERADTVYDVAEAKKIYSKALTLIAEDAPSTFLAWNNTIHAMSRAVRGFAPSPDLLPRLREVWLAK